MVNAISMLYRKSMMYKADRNYVDAEPLAREYLERIEQSYGAEHHDVAAGAMNLADILESLASTASRRKAREGYEEALKLYKRALAIRLKTCDKREDDIAESLRDTEISDSLQKIAYLLHILEGSRLDDDVLGYFNT
eukprot:513674-Prorocentrum_minimum.AAC.1